MVKHQHGREEIIQERRTDRILYKAMRWAAVTLFGGFCASAGFMIQKQWDFNIGILDTQNQITNSMEHLNAATSNLSNVTTLLSQQVRENRSDIDRLDERVIVNKSEIDRIRR